MDSITLTDIAVWTRIGVPEAERGKAQLLHVTVEITGSLKIVSANDDVTNGIDYKAVTDAIVALGETERRTIERFAEDTAATILRNWNPESVRVRVSKKPDLPLSSASVTITRP